ncbi:flavin-containing monooxygenase [Ramlibacter albus]|uniref:NAD(P)/FAD-dependent oxidoreductase n=1 Tax=Ramlibacter albus TaxID=2079448 RepID=A0A923MD86_9BURK|nr:NAD(P)/FAD-dependent oxidoreductase [Ramlibacter albus]MBC5768555.1 NAD(P)/FAD-dependent oxidoreductase [Ramlibacter albus]
MNHTDEAELLDLLIVGAGFSGMAMLHRCRAMGLRALAIEAAPSVGGTWYHNRYPGARVDIQSLEYSFSIDEDLQQEWHWTERYASQPELLRYANHVADRLDLRRDIRLSTRLEEAHWDEATATWHAQATNGSRWRARFILMATGPLSAPSSPHFEGLDNFGGRVLHTAAWPHEPVDFEGLKVGVVGTGSSGVQVIPQLARRAKSVTVFQRTPAYVVPAHNGPLDPAWEASIKGDYPGFRARTRKMRGGFGSEHPPYMVSALDVAPEERQARYEERWRVGGFAFLGTFYDTMLDERSNALAAEFVRDKIRATVRDPQTAAALCPDYPIGCKRLCVDSAGYYETYNLPHVSLVDLRKSPIERVTQRGIVSGGTEHDLDVLVLATGFDAMTGTLMRLDVRGRDGATFREQWQHGPLNYLGLMTRGFPNLFHIAGAGSTAAFTNVIVSIEHHVDWIATCIAWMRERGLASIEPGEDAQAAWMDYVLQTAKGTVMLGCNSWYLGANVPGKPRVFMPLISGYPAYAERCAQVAARGYEGFVLE